MMLRVDRVPKEPKQAANEQLAAAAWQRGDGSFQIHRLIRELLSLLAPSVHRCPEHLCDCHAVK
jgi:hypothetical protein